MSEMRAHTNLHHNQTWVCQRLLGTPPHTKEHHINQWVKDRSTEINIHAQARVVHCVCLYSVMRYPRNVEDFASIWKPQFELLHCVAPSKPWCILCDLSVRVVVDVCWACHARVWSREPIVLMHDKNMAGMQLSQVCMACAWLNVYVRRHMGHADLHRYSSSTFVCTCIVWK